ncbi:hypothetical protein FA15DRAFT_332467 [Coprinopsis marcescibilis]|uniref:Uncharacterized protein n=1 Tax=Coprinopsis marcescibilis TaxID=230819 RepID=A0A5C3KC95_COPMA|nr:hypothetical protein FA15DRAFT_332467 [Coprinopsis marcescibilis]
MTSDAQDTTEQEPSLAMDPIWSTSRTARQIYDLGGVEKDITRLLRLAATSVALLTLPQTDGPGDKLPQDGERSEQFVVEVGEYFERLNSIQSNIRSGLSHVRRSRIAPSAIIAPPQDFVPPSLGVGRPNDLRNPSTKNRGLQEEKVDRDAWHGILEALTRLKEARDAESQGNTKPSEPSQSSDAMEE